MILCNIMTESLDSHAENLLIEQQSKTLKGVELRLMMNIWGLKNHRYIQAVGVRKKVVSVYNKAISEAQQYTDYSEIEYLINKVKATYKKYDNKYRDAIPKLVYEMDMYGLN